MLPHEKTEILGCKSVKLLYFIPMLPTVVQSMMFHLHADLPYCGLKRLNSESRCWFAQYPAPFPICVARVRSSFIHNNLPVMRTNECSYPSLVRFCTREELQAFLGNWVIVPVINCVTPYNALQDTLGMSHETTTQKFK